MKNVRITFALLFIVTCFSIIAQRPVRVACIGNSITYGATIANPNKDSYPSQLSDLLGTNYEVRNFGYSGRTMLRNGDRPYSKEKALLQQISNFQPEIVIVKLGTNDSKPHNWIHREQFVADMDSIVLWLKSFSSQPKTYLGLPTCSTNRFGIRDSVIKHEIIPMIRTYASLHKLEIIDFYTPMIEHTDLMPDGVHPNEMGARILAQTAYRSIKGTEPPLHPVPSKLFRSGDRVCFIGNSITHSGHYWSYIALYYATRFPWYEIEYFNCGISGDIASGIMRRMKHDILENRPTVATVMIGMNDVKRQLHDPRSKRSATEKEEQVEQVYNDYLRNTAQVDSTLTRHVRQLTLITPSIYDQTAQLKSHSLVGVNDQLGRFGRAIADMAPRYGANVADFWTPMTEINERLQKKDPSATLIGGDRIHPSESGGLVMASLFLRDMDAPAVVSDIQIDIHAKSQKMTNGRLYNFKNNSSNLTFTVDPYALPFPLSEKMKIYSGEVDFHETLNREIIQIKGLKSGRYALRIEGIEVGTYTDKEFDTGINLATNELTPQYRQALKVLAAVDQFKNKTYTHRMIELIDHSRLKDYAHKGNIDSCRAEVRRIYEKEKDKKTWSASQLLGYISYKPKQKEVADTLRMMNQNFYQINKPKTLHYEIQRTK